MNDKVIQEQLDFHHGAYKEVLSAAGQIKFDSKHLPDLMARTIVLRLKP